MRKPKIERCRGCGCELSLHELNMLYGWCYVCARPLQAPQVEALSDDFIANIWKSAISR